MHCKFFQRSQIHYPKHSWVLLVRNNLGIFYDKKGRHRGLALRRSRDVEEGKNPTRRGKHASTSGWLGQNHYWRKQTALRLPTYTPKTPFSNFSSSLLPKNCTYSTPYSGYLQAKIQLNLCTNKEFSHFLGYTLLFWKIFRHNCSSRQKVVSKDPFPASLSTLNLQISSY